MAAREYIQRRVERRPSVPIEKSTARDTAGELVGGGSQTETEVMTGAGAEGEGLSMEIEKWHHGTGNNQNSQTKETPVKLCSADIRYFYGQFNA